MIRNNKDFVFAIVVFVWGMCLFLFNSMVVNTIGIIVMCALILLKKNNKFNNWLER